MMKKKVFKPEERRAAKRLRKIWDERKTELNLTQEKVCELFGWDSQSTASQYINGIIALNFPTVLLFAIVLKISASEIYPELFSNPLLKHIGEMFGHAVIEQKIINVDALTEILIGVQKAIDSVGMDWGVAEFSKLSAELYALYASTGTPPDFDQMVQLQALRSGAG